MNKDLYMTYAAISAATFLLGSGSVLFFTFRKKADDPSWLEKFDDRLYVKDRCDDNFDRVLDAIGIKGNDKLALKSQQLSIMLQHLNGKNYSLRHSADNQVTDYKFTPGQEFNLVDSSGKKTTVLVKQEKNVLTEFASWTEAGSVKKSQTTHVFTDKEVTITTSVDNLSSVCVFKLKA